MSWICSCGLRNSGLNLQCAGLDQSILGCSEHYQVSSNSPDELMAIVAWREATMLSDKEKERLEKVRLHLTNGTNPYSKDEIKTVAVGENREPIQRPRIEHVVPNNIANKAKGMTEQEELYAKFYAKGKLLVADMDVTQLREHRETLSQIAFEAKATLAAADDELRERKAKTSVKAKEWLVTPTGPDQTTSDAINAVKVRKERMSKLDKQRADLLKIGIDKEIVDEMIRNMERKATEQNLKTVTFSKPTTETSIVTVQVAKPTENGESKPAFNPSTLSFGGSK